MTDRSGKTALVTGASGSLARGCLSRLIDAGYRVVATSRSRQAELSVPGVEWHHVDLLRPGAPGALIKRVQPDLVIHSAWETEHGVFWTSPANLEWVHASIELIDSFVDHGGQRFVFTGTCCEYEWGSESPLPEDTTPENPATLYGQSKLRVTRHLLEREASGDVEAVAARIFFPYGPFEAPTRFVGYIVRQMMRGEAAELSSCHQIRDFSYTDDLSDGLVKVALSTLAGRVNVASGEGVSLRTIAETIAAKIGRPELLVFGQYKPVTTDPPFVVANADKVRPCWQPSVDLDSGIENFIRVLQADPGAI